MGLSTRAKRQPGEALLGDIAIAKLEALAEALDLPERELERMVALFEEMSSPWAS